MLVSFIHFKMTKIELHFHSTWYHMRKGKSCVLEHFQIYGKFVFSKVGPTFFVPWWVCGFQKWRIVLMLECRKYKMSEERKSTPIPNPQTNFRKTCERSLFHTKNKFDWFCQLILQNDCIHRTGFSNSSNAIDNRADYASYWKISFDTRVS